MVCVLGFFVRFCVEAWLPYDGLQFYTDGSLFEGRAGSGVFSEELELKISFTLGTFTAVFQAEVHAIMACSDYCLRKCMTSKMVCICSGSQAALLALSSHTVSSRLVLQCRNSLQGLFIHNGVQLFWVPWHCSIKGNEEADGLAEVGSKSSFCGPEPCLPVPKSLMTRVTKKWLSDNHLSYWNLVSECRQHRKKRVFNSYAFL
jgi:ribonuclease HI